MKADGVLQLPHVGIIKVSGLDAASFLNNQLSNDILHMNKNEVKIAAYCSPQGRVLASFLVLQTQPEEFLLLCWADIVEDTLKRLKMFVLRSKVELSDVSSTMQAYGSVTLRDASSPTPTPWTYSSSDDLISIKLPYVGNMLKSIILTSQAENLPLTSKLPMGTWTWLYVRSGIAMINQSIKEQYLPQMLNYESIGAIDFKKGCYPGQEVVSRSQFRGSLKRHAYIIHTQQEIKQGDEIYLVPKKDEEATPSSMGEVVTSAANPDGGWDAIAVLRIEAEDSKLTLTPQTPQLEETMVSILPLPYERITDF